MGKKNLTESSASFLKMHTGNWHPASPHDSVDHKSITNNKLCAPLHMRRHQCYSCGIKNFSSPDLKLGLTSYLVF